jgi:hypothetical protein
VAYATQFLIAENPISEAGSWTTGKSAGLDWADITVIPGLAYRVETGTAGYDDATALLTGTWRADQMAEGAAQNGPLGKFFYLARAHGAKYRVQATDGTYAVGNPGMGFFPRGTAGANMDCGFTSVKMVRW